MGRKRQPIKHGTYSGARAHRKRGIPLCEPCREAERERNREYNRKVASGEHKPVKREPIECGTRRGYFRHYRKGEKACKACRGANAAAMREYRKANPDYVEWSRQNDKEYSKRPEVRKKRYAYQAAQDRTPGTPRYYRKRARNLRRYAAQKGGDVTHGVSRAGLLGKIEMWGGRCWICRIKLDETNLTFDHVKPLSKGGVDILANIRPCCRTCNCKKGNKWPLTEVESARA